MYCVVKVGGGCVKMDVRKALFRILAGVWRDLKEELDDVEDTFDATEEGLDRIAEVTREELGRLINESKLTRAEAQILLCFGSRLSVYTIDDLPVDGMSYHIKAYYLRKLKDKGMLSLVTQSSLLDNGLRNNRKGYNYYRITEKGMKVVCGLKNEGR